MARTLHGYISSHGHSAHHARDLNLERVSDIEWISTLAQSKEEWILVTGDLRIHKNGAERTAYRQARLKGVVLAPAFQRIPLGRACASLIARWDELVDFLSTTNPPVLVRLNIGFRSKFDILPL